MYTSSLLEDDNSNKENEMINSNLIKRETMDKIALRKNNKRNTTMNNDKDDNYNFNPFSKNYKMKNNINNKGNI